MNSFPSSTCFKFPWRSYQKKILDEFNQHIQDRHLHIVAPPGSGKTVLGLEALHKFNSPCLIFAPTITIRNKWIEIFLDLFLPDDMEKSNIDWISTSIKDIRFMTVVTYQSIHSLFTTDSSELEESVLDEESQDTTYENKESEKYNAEAISSFILELNRKGVKTILFDEAHHLRTEWWKALINIKQSLNNAFFISLTATPPYDSEPLEWQRYISLCGEIDMEIYIPELVRNNDLCPHQDYIFLSTPRQDEADSIKKIEESINTAIDTIIEETAFVSIYLSHKCIMAPMQNIENILDNYEYYYSILLFFNDLVSGNKNSNTTFD